MRQAYRLAHRSVFTIPVENIGWLPKKRVKATFIPIGANIPEPQGTSAETDPGTSRLKTVAVFGVTGGDRIAREVRDITYAMRCVSEKHSQLRLVVLGRNSTDAEVALRSALQGTGVVVQILGVIPAEEITRCLSLADVQLFVRGPIAATRGSAIAGIACGLPIVCYAGHETGFPITEAGLQLVPDGDRDALAVALDRVLSNDQLRRELRWRSLRAYADYFSWARIVEQFAMELTSG
jgi:glycosyltransferase involved in cell wall biosynthesis